jgi:hypothetical protein
MHLLQEYLIIRYGEYSILQPVGLRSGSKIEKQVGVVLVVVIALINPDSHPHILPHAFYMWISYGQSHFETLFLGNAK